MGLLVRVLNPRKSPWADPREGLPTTDILLQGKPHEKGSGQGLWTYMVMGQKFLWTVASYYLRTLCVGQGVLPFSSPHKGIGVMVHMVEMWSGAVRKKSERM